MASGGAQFTNERNSGARCPEGTRCVEDKPSDARKYADECLSIDPHAKLPKACQDARLGADIKTENNGYQDNSKWTTVAPENTISVPRFNYRGGVTPDTLAQYGITTEVVGDKFGIRAKDGQFLAFDAKTDYVDFEKRGDGSLELRVYDRPDRRMDRSCSLRIVTFNRDGTFDVAENANRAFLSVNDPKALSEVLGKRGVTFNPQRGTIELTNANNGVGGVQELNLTTDVTSITVMPTTKRDDIRVSFTSVTSKETTTPEGTAIPKGTRERQHFTVDRNGAITMSELERNY